MSTVTPYIESNREAAAVANQEAPLKRVVDAVEELQIALLYAAKLDIFPNQARPNLPELENYLSDLLGDVEPVQSALAEKLDIWASRESLAPIGHNRGPAHDLLADRADYHARTGVKPGRGATA